MRYIDADALKKSVEGLTDCYNGFSDTYDKACIIGLIDEEPTVDAEEVKHGHWEEQIVDDSTIIEIWQSARCSKCGRYHTTPYAYYFDKFNYCPNCGARMDEVAK